MHIIQYLLNLNLRCFAYDGSGKIKIAGYAKTSATIFQIKSVLKFVPFDIGYDINGVEWRVIDVYYNNNIAYYTAYNGTDTVTFDNFSLFNAAEINYVYQNKLDDKIQVIVDKLKQLESYIPTPEKPSIYSPIKFLPDDIAYDINGVEWRILSVYELNNSFIIKATNETETKDFKEEELFTDNQLLENAPLEENKLYNAAQINSIYISRLDDRIQNIANALKQLESYVPIPEKPPIHTTIKFRPNDVAYDVDGVQWRIISIHESNNIFVIKATNQTEIKDFKEEELFINTNKTGNIIAEKNKLYNASQIEKIYQANLDSKIQNVIDKINQFGGTGIVKNKFNKGESCIDKKLNNWTITNIFNLENKIKYQVTNGKVTKIFNENDLKKTSKK